MKIILIIDSRANKQSMVDCIKFLKNFSMTHSDEAKKSREITYVPFEFHI